MKAQIDENLPSSLARSIDPVAREHDHEVVHVRDFIGAGTSDIALFHIAVEQGVRVHVTLDQHHLRTKERDAIQHLGLIVFVLSKGWNTLDLYHSAARLLEWWPEMMRKAEGAAPGTIFKVPHLRAPLGRLTPVRSTR